MDIWEINKILLFAVMILPGFISIKVYDLIFAGEKRDFSKSLVELVAYSVLNFATLWWLIKLISTENFYNEHIFITWLIILLVFVVCPCIWPLLFFKASKSKLFKNHFLSPINQPWDHVFNKRDSYWVVVHLKDKRVIRGKYGIDSFASAYPQERQIYLQELWKGKEKGGFDKKIDRTEGIILFESEIKSIEFYK